MAHSSPTYIWTGRSPLKSTDILRVAFPRQGRSGLREASIEDPAIEQVGRMLASEETAIA